MEVWIEPGGDEPVADWRVSDYDNENDRSDSSRQINGLSLLASGP